MIEMIKSKGVSATDYESTIVMQGQLDMIGKVAKQIIREIDTKNPMSVLEKGKIENGDTVENAVVRLLESSPYDENGTGALSPDKTKKLSVRYFKDWTRGKFKTTVYPYEIRKTLLQNGSEDELGTKLVAALGKSDIYEKYTFIKELLKWGTTNASGEDGLAPVLKDVGEVEMVNGKIDYDGVLKKIKNTVSGMSYVNGNFNSIGLKRSTPKEDIYVVMPYTLKNAMDVEKLSAVFNLDKAEIKDKIIEIDIPDEEDMFVYIIDKNAIQVYTRVYDMFSQLNGDGAFWNYFLHTDRLYAISPLFDGTFFKVEK